MSDFRRVWSQRQVKAVQRAYVIGWRRSATAEPQQQQQGLLSGRSRAGGKMQTSCGKHAEQRPDDTRWSSCLRRFSWFLRLLASLSSLNTEDGGMISAATISPSSAFVWCLCPGWGLGCSDTRWCSLRFWRWEAAWQVRRRIYDAGPLRTISLGTVLLWRCSLQKCVYEDDI